MKTVFIQLNQKNMEHEPCINRRKPGPFLETEVGPVVGDVIVPTGQPVYRGGTVPTFLDKPIILRPPLDKGENGSAWNNNSEFPPTLI